MRVLVTLTENARTPGARVGKLFCQPFYVSDPEDTGHLARRAYPMPEYRNYDVEGEH